MPAEDLNALVAELRATGGDTPDVEVKAAAGGLPQSLTSTLSALANHPGGGTIILGLDEANGFQPVPLPNRQTLKQGLASKARGFTPPVRLTVRDGEVDGKLVIVAAVHECDPADKPCRVTSTGRAYMRVYDGDYEMSPQEQQAFMAARRPPHADREPVDGARIDDLDRDLLAEWAMTARVRSSALTRFSDDELYRRTGVLDADGRPTVAGMLTFGIHPQQWFPRYVIQAAVLPGAGAGLGARVSEPTLIDGPVPLMLDAAMDWARRTFPRSVEDTASGDVRDRTLFPLTAFRELVANALIHRDLSAWSETLAVEVRLLPDLLTVVNPGGLYGVTVDRLGKESVSSPRNARLISLCQDARTPDGNRVVEGLSTGLQKVAATLAEQGLPAARYFDSGSRFTALLSARVEPAKPPVAPNTTAGRVYAELVAGPLSVADLEDRLQLKGPNIRKVLRELADRGLVTRTGGRGKPTVYQRASGG